MEKEIEIVLSLVYDDEDVDETTIPGHDDLARAAAAHLQEIFDNDGIAVSVGACLNADRDDDDEDFIETDGEDDGDDPNDDDEDE